MIIREVLVGKLFSQESLCGVNDVCLLHETRNLLPLRVVIKIQNIDKSMYFQQKVSPFMYTESVITICRKG